MTPYIYSAAGVLCRAILLASCLLFWFPDNAFGQTCSHFLNATDGADSNTGTSPADAVRSFEYAFRTFPSDAVVCMTGGEYFHSLDADGVQLTGLELAGKNMRFVLQNFAGANVVAFTEDELLIDIGTGRVEFVSGSTSTLQIGSGTINSPQDYPANTTFLHTLAMLSGSLDVSGVSLTIGASVGNPDFRRADNAAFEAPDSATIAHGTGTLVGSPVYEDAVRILTYVGTGDRSAGNEVPPTVGGLFFRHESGMVRIQNAMQFASGAVIELAGSGSAQITSAVSLTGAVATPVVVSGSGTLDLAGPLSITLGAAVPVVARLTSSGGLTLRNLDLTFPSATTVSPTSVENLGNGILAVHAVEAGTNVDLKLNNAGGGSCMFGTPSAATSIDAEIVNGAGAECTIEGGTGLSRDVMNEGSLTITGPLEVTTLIQNSGDIHLEADVTLSGTLINSGHIDVGAHALAVSGAGPHQNDGDIASSTGTGRIALTATTTIAGEGELPALASLSGAHDVSGSLVSGIVAIVTGAQLTLKVDRVDGTVSVEGGHAALAVGNTGTLDVQSGTAILGMDLVTGDYIQRAGSNVDLSSHRLSLTGSFERTGGVFASGGGGLRFIGAAIQPFSPGPDLIVDDIHVEGTDVQLTSGPLQVRDSLVIGADAHVLLFDFALRLIGPNSVVVNNGEISTSVTGSLVFGGPEGSVQRITGEGLYGNVQIDMQDEDDVVTVEQADVRQGGVLNLSSGRLRLSVGSSYALVSHLGVPLIRRNLGDGDGDGDPAGKPIEANTPTTGSFDSPVEGYNLEYVGTLSGPAAVGAELLSGRIVDLAVDISGGSGAPASLSLAGEVSFTGALELGRSTRLLLNGFDLRATGSGRTHVVAGSIESTTGAFVVSGGSVRVEGAAGGPSGIHSLRIESDGSVVTESIRSIAGTLEIVSGSLDLHLAAAHEDSSETVRRVVVREGGELVLGGEVVILEEVRLPGGMIDLGSFDLVLAAGSVFDAAAPAGLAVGRDGAVVVRGESELTLAGVTMPRLRAEMPETSTLHVAGGLHISESLVMKSGILDLGSDTLTVSAGAIELLGGRFLEPAVIAIDGAVDAQLGPDFVIPNLLIRSADPAVGLSLRSASSTPRRLIVSGRVELRRGHLNLGRQDLLVDGSGGGVAVLAYEGGTLTMDGGTAIADAAIGELVLGSAELDLDLPLELSNLRVSAVAAFRSGSAPFVVQQQITFGDGRLENVDSTRIQLAEGVRVVRRGTGSFLEPPQAEGPLDLYYDIRGATLVGGALSTSLETQAAAGIRSVTIDAGANTLRLADDIRVSELLRLNSGVLDRNGYGLLVEAGGTVQYDRSSLIEPSFADESFTAGGAVRLVFSGTMDIASTDLTFPSAITVSELVVSVGGSGEDGASFILHANRRIERLVVAATASHSGADLNGRTLLVNKDVAVRSGVIQSATEAILEVGDSLVVDPEGSIRGVVGVLARGDVSIGGLFDSHLLRSFGDVTVTGRFGGVEEDPISRAEQSIEGLPNLEFSGSDQVLRIKRADDDPRSIDEAIHRLILSSTGVLRLEAPRNSSFTLAVNRLELRSGVIRTNANDLRLPHDGPGFQHAENAASHVDGRISRHFRAGQTGTFEFPLGSAGGDSLYRPVFITFSEDDPLGASSLITIGHSGTPPGGYLGLPLDAGEQVVLGDVSAFHWSLSAVPELPSSQTYSLGVVGSGLKSYSAARNLRLVRREPGAAWEHAWESPASAAQYDNAVVSLDGRNVPFVQVMRSEELIPSEGVVLGIGIEESQIDFARVQVVNLSDRSAAGVLVQDSLTAAALGVGQATPYFRVNAGRIELRVEGDNGFVLARDSLDFEVGVDYVVAVVGGGREGAPVLVRRESMAVPPLSAKENVSLAFFHNVPDAPPLLVRMRGDLTTLFASVRYAEMSDSYAILPPENTGFDLLGAQSGERLFSWRSNLESHAGETITAFATGYLNPPQGGSNDVMDVLLFSNHGRLVARQVQVDVEEPVEVPASFALHGNYPNPFNPSTVVSFDLPEAADVTVEVFDLLGRSVMRLRSDAMAPGRREVRIDASSLPSGVYLYRVTAEGTATHVAGGKMTLVR